MDWRVPFTFCSTSEILLGPGVSRQVGAKAKDLGGRHALVVSGRSMAENGVADKVMADLRAAGLEATPYGGVVHDPTIEVVEQGAAVFRQAGCDLLVGLGGGSAIDTAKAIGVLITNGRALTDYEGANKLRQAIPPLIAMPTTAGTGSEATRAFVVTDSSRQFKFVVNSTYLFPKVAICDPELTLTLPALQTASTALDAMVQCIEPYSNAAINPLVDMVALTGLELLARNLRLVVARGDNLEARTQVMLAALLSGLSGNVGTGMAHALSHPLGARYPIPHGFACTVVLPYVMEFNLSGCLEKYATIARILGERSDGLSERAFAARAISAVRQMAADVGCPPRLRDFGVQPESFPAMVKDAMTSGNVRTSARAITEKEVLEIYQAAY